MANASVALDSARSYLNDVNGQIWTDATLLPFLKESYRDLLLVLWINGLPVLRTKSASIAVAIGALTLNLPADLLEPIWLKERAQGSSEDWIPMVESDFEPDITQSTTLKYWAWREEKIDFIGATTAREVQLRYHKTLTEPTSGASALGFIFAELFLGPQCAAYAASSVGNITRAEELLYIPDQHGGIAGSKISQIVRANIKGQQNLPARRIPYRRFSRSKLLL